MQSNQQINRLLDFIVEDFYHEYDTLMLYLLVDSYRHKSDQNTHTTKRKETAIVLIEAACTYYPCFFLEMENSVKNVKKALGPTTTVNLVTPRLIHREDLDQVHDTFTVFFAVQSIKYIPMTSWGDLAKNWRTSISSR